MYDICSAPGSVGSVRRGPDMKGDASLMRQPRSLMAEMTGSDHALPASVRVCECWSRDGIQSWSEVIPTDQKVAVLDRALAAGVREFDATSFVPVKVVPQFFDSVAILDHLAGRDVYV